MLSEEKKLLKRKFLIKLKRQRMLQIFAWAGLVYILIFNYAPMAGILVAFKKFSIKDGFMGIFTNFLKGRFFTSVIIIANNIGAGNEANIFRRLIINVFFITGQHI